MHSSKGIIFALLAAFFLTLMSLFVKLSSSINNESLVFFRNIICLILLSPFLLHKNVNLSTKRLPLHFVRALIGMFGIYALFYSVKHLHLTKAILLLNTVPLFIPLVVLIWLKIKISKKRFFMLLTGFVGVVIIVRPETGSFDIATIVGIFGGLCSATALVSIRLLTKTEHHATIMFYFFSFAVLISFFPMLFAWEKIGGFQAWGIIGLIGLSAVLYQRFLTLTYREIPATKAGCLFYIGVLFGGVADWVVWGYLPDSYTLIGSVLIVLGGVGTLLDKSQSKSILK